MKKIAIIIMIAFIQPAIFATDFKRMKEKYYAKKTAYMKANYKPGAKSQMRGHVNTLSFNKNPYPYKKNIFDKIFKSNKKYTKAKIGKVI